MSSVREQEVEVDGDGGTIKSKHGGIELYNSKIILNETNHIPQRLRHHKKLGDGDSI